MVTVSIVFVDSLIMFHCPQLMIMPMSFWMCLKRWEQIRSHLEYIIFFSLHFTNIHPVQEKTTLWVHPYKNNKKGSAHPTKRFDHQDTDFVDNINDFGRWAHINVKLHFFHGWTQRVVFSCIGWHYKGHSSGPTLARVCDALYSRSEFYLHKYTIWDVQNHQVFFPQGGQIFCRWV